MRKRIALLGWGSLLWEPNEAFDAHHGPWESGGPILKLEFSRKSQTRLNALTLVIDEVHGSQTTVAYSLSSRFDVDDAIIDLRCREGTTLKNIGFVRKDTGRHQCRSEGIHKSIDEWAVSKKMDAVVWTDLASNFEGFSVPAAIAHIQGLEPKAKVKAAEYVWRAPEFVDTKLRVALQAEPWFKK